MYMSLKACSVQDRRPYLATECDNLQQAEKWRRQIIGEVSRKVAQIQNGEYWVMVEMVQTDHWWSFFCNQVLKYVNLVGIKSHGIILHTN